MTRLLQKLRRLVRGSARILGSRREFRSYEREAEGDAGIAAQT
jgi:hypothetical protein